jgi:hypothetical protein
MTTVVGAALILILAPAAGAQDAPGIDTEAWSASVLPQAEGSSALVTGVAVGPSSMVAVGQRACTQGRRETSRCWGLAWTSPDGTTWEAVDPRSSGLDLGLFRPIISGPEVGLEGVAYGPGGFLAFGRVGEPGGQRSAVWRSDDGSSWERVTASDAFPTRARLRTILGAEDGYLLGGVTYFDKAPRAAIWSSPDGRTWTPARGEDQVFEIGGYIDTMEDPQAGGVNAFALFPGPDDGAGAIEDGVIAVGQRCMPSFDRDPWAWNGTCWGQQWRSEDGLTWRAGDMPRTQGAVTLVATAGDRIVTDAPVCAGDCASALLLRDDVSDWRVAYGSPVDGELEALVSVGGHFQALLAVRDEDGEVDGDRLALWSSGDGTDWALEEAQPTLPATITWLDEVDVAVAGERLVVTTWGQSAPEGDNVSIALLSPPLP